MLTLTPLKTAIQATARRMGVHIIRENHIPQGFVPADFSEEEAALFLRVRPFTLTPPERVVSLWRAAVHVLEDGGVPGDFVETGVWKGGSARVMAEALARSGPGRNLWLYDVWDRQAWPAPVERDGQAARAFWDEYQAQQSIDAPALETAQRNVREAGLPDDRVRFVVGRVEETIPSRIPDAIAILRIDTDFYESVKHALTHLYPRLSRGGVLILDDYACPQFTGARRAVDEYFAEHGPKPLLARIDVDSRIAVKL